MFYVNLRVDSHSLDHKRMVFQPSVTGTIIDENDGTRRTHYIFGRINKSELNLDFWSLVKEQFGLNGKYFDFVAKYEETSRSGDLYLGDKPFFLQPTLP